MNINFKEYATLYTGEETNNSYKEWFDNNEKDIIIAHLYTKHYYVFKQATENFIGLDEFEIEDIILTQIWRCLDQYDDSKSNGKITTYICKYIRSACRNATQAENSNKRKINQRHISTLFSEYEDKDDLDRSKIEFGYSEVEMEQYLTQLNLSDNQYKYCHLVLTGNPDIKMAEIAKELNISRAGALGIKKQLQDILKDLVA